MPPSGPSTRLRFRLAACPAGRACPRRRSARIGAASVEAMITLPVIIIALAGLMYVGAAYRTAVALSLPTRRDAWHFALSGCEAAVGAETTLVRAGEALGAGGPAQGGLARTVALMPYIAPYLAELSVESFEAYRLNTVRGPELSNLAYVKYRFAKQPSVLVGYATATVCGWPARDGPPLEKFRDAAWALYAAF